MNLQFIPSTVEALAAYRVILTLHAHNHEAYLVGGCVRDLALGREVHDYDVTTNAAPYQVKALFPKTILVGEKFGVVKVVDGEVQTEVATYRTDGVYGEDNRRPDQVTYSTHVADDVARRDFTINGLLLDPRTVLVYDYTNGAEDLQKREITAIGDPNVRFQEDALRMLRAVRFMAQLDFTISDTTFRSITENVNRLHVISGERIASELCKMLTSGQAGKAVRTMMATGILHVILPEIAQLLSVPQSPKHHPEGDVFTHTCLLLDQLKAGCSETLALSTLFHDVAKYHTYSRDAEGGIHFYGHEDVGAKVTERIMRRLKFPNVMIDCVVHNVKEHMRPYVLPEMRLSKARAFLGQEGIEELMDLNFMDIKASSGDFTSYGYMVDMRKNTALELLKPPTLVNGDDLIAMGMKPGPQFKSILDEIRDRQYAGKVVDREHALCLVRDMNLDLKEHLCTV
jgi:poly(A) polymerase